MPYYGPGPDSQKSGRSDYRMEDTNVELRPGFRLPLDRFRVADGKLAFDDRNAGRSYDVSWSSYDNDHRRLTALPNASGTNIPPLASGTDYLAATIARGSATVTVYLRRDGASFEVVGLDR